MNTLPNDIIISELFPKLTLSKIFDLTIAYPPWLPVVKKYILDIGRQLSPDIPQEDYKDVLKSLVYKEDIYNRFLHLKSFIPVTVYLLTIGYDSKIEEVENDLYPRIQHLYQYFSDDMMKHLDTIFSRTIIHPPSLLYAVRNKPPEFLAQGHYDVRILINLFPTFSSKFHSLIFDYLFRMNIPPKNSILNQIKTEINFQLYNMFHNFN
jgi:hypothetical protein